MAAGEGYCALKTNAVTTWRRKAAFPIFFMIILK